MFVSSMPEKSWHPRDARRRARGTCWVRATVRALLLMLLRPAPPPVADRFVNGRPPAAPAPSAAAAASCCPPWPALAAAPGRCSAAPAAPASAAGSTHARAAPAGGAASPLRARRCAPVRAAAERRQLPARARPAPPPGSNAAPRRLRRWPPAPASAPRPALPESPPPCAAPRGRAPAPGRRRPGCGSASPSSPDEPGPAFPLARSYLTPFVGCRVRHQPHIAVRIPAQVAAAAAGRVWMTLQRRLPRRRRLFVTFIHAAGHHPSRTQRLGQGFPDCRLVRHAARRRHQIHLLTLAVRPGQDHPLPLGMHAERLAAHLPGQIERLPGHTLAGQLQGVGRHPRLQRLLHLRGHAEVALGRHQAVNAAVRPLEIVTINEPANPPLGVPQIEEHGRLDTLAPERSPEAFDLAQRLRPSRRRHHLLDAPLLQLLGERALAPPGDVLRAVVGQDLLGRAIGREG